MSTQTALRWGSYRRISEDADDTQRGVARQDADNREAIAVRGGELVEDYPENDTSAYKQRKVKVLDADGNEYVAYRVIRPVWQRALRDLREGRIDALMVWDIDRLARDPRDLEDAIEAVVYHRKRIESVSGSIDLMSHSGQAMARVMVAMANKSSADTARRVKRAHLEAARNGVPVGGVRAFGYMDDKRTPHPVESVALREAVEGLLSGETNLLAIVKDWNARGLRSTRGNQFTHKSVGQILFNSARYAGIREYEGVEYDGDWTPILTRDQHAAMQAHVADRSKVASCRPGARKYLLSGIIRCALCGATMVGRNSRARKDGAPLHNYACNASKSNYDHTLAINGPTLDHAVTEAALKVMADAILPQIEAVERDEDEQRIAVIDDEIRAALAMMRAKQVSASTALAITAELEAEKRDLVAARRSRADVQQRSQVRRVTPETFAAMSIEDQRDLVLAWVEHVVVSPAKTRGGSGRSGRVDLSRVEIVWRG